MERAMSELPQIFDSKTGAFRSLDDTAIGGLTALQYAAYRACERAAGNVAEKDQAEAAIQERVAKCIADLSAAEQYLTDNFPPITFQDLWNENFGRK
jgi:hypothetical protein